MKTTLRWSARGLTVALMVFVLLPLAGLLVGAMVAIAACAAVRAGGMGSVRNVDS